MIADLRKFVFFSFLLSKANLFYITQKCEVVVVQIKTSDLFGIGDFISPKGLTCAYVTINGEVEKKEVFTEVIVETMAFELFYNFLLDSPYDEVDNDVVI